MTQIFNHGQTCRLSRNASPVVSMWTTGTSGLPLMKPVEKRLGSYWFDLGQVKLLAAVYSLHALGFTVKRSIETALAWSHMSDAHTTPDGRVIVDREMGGVHSNAMTLTVTRPGQQFGEVVAVDPGRPFISVWKELLGTHDAITIVDCDRVLGGVTDRLEQENH